MTNHLLFSIFFLLMVIVLPSLSQAAVDPISLAQDAYHNNEYQRAIRWYDEALSVNPTDQTALVGRLKALAALSEWNEVLNGITRSGLSSNENDEVALLLAEGYVKTGKADEGLNILDQSSGLNRTDEIRIRSEALVALQRESEAISLLNETEQEGPLDPRLSLLMGTILIDKGNITPALPYLEDAYLNLPRDPDAPAALGKAVASLGMYEESLIFLKSAADINQTDPNLWVSIAFLSTRLGRYDEALAALEHPLALNPSDPNLLNAKAYALYLSGRGGEGRTLAEEVLRQVPTDPGAMDTLGCILLSEGDTEGAVKYLEQAAKVLSHDPEVLAHLAEADHAIGNDQQAQDLYQRSLAIDSTSGRAWRGYSEVLLALQRYPEAAEAIAKAFNYYPGDSELISWEKKADDVLVDWYLKKEAQGNTTESS